MNSKLNIHLFKDKKGRNRTKFTCRRMSSNNRWIYIADNLLRNSRLWTSHYVIMHNILGLMVKLCLTNTTQVGWPIKIICQLNLQSMWVDQLSSWVDCKLPTLSMFTICQQKFVYSTNLASLPQSSGRYICSTIMDKQINRHIQAARTPFKLDLLSGMLNWQHLSRLKAAIPHKYEICCPNFLKNSYKCWPC